MFFPDESGHLGSGTLLKIEVGLEHRQTAKTSKVGLSYVSLNTNKSGTSAASLSESSCLLHESRTNIILRMDLRSLVELAHDSAGRVRMREELDLPRRPPTGGARGFWASPLGSPAGHVKFRPYWPSRLQRGWMRPAPGFARRTSPPFPTGH